MDENGGEIMHAKRTSVVAATVCAALVPLACSDSGGGGGPCADFWQGSCAAEVFVGNCRGTLGGACVMRMDGLTFDISWESGHTQHMECDGSGQQVSECDITIRQDGSVCNRYTMRMVDDQTVAIEKNGKTWQVVTTEDEIRISCPGGASEIYTKDELGTCGNTGETEACAWGCDTDVDCPVPGQSCQDGVCQGGTGQCTDHEDCPAGQYCVMGYCTDQEPDCLDDADCDPGEVCHRGACVPEELICTSDADCEPWQECQEMTSMCMQRTCSTDADCNADGVTCQHGYCIPGG